MTPCEDERNIEPRPGRDGTTPDAHDEPTAEDMDVCWNRTEEGSYEAEVGPWSVEISPKDADPARSWAVRSTYGDSPIVALSLEPSLEEAQRFAVEHARRHDFDAYVRSSPELLARFLHALLLGIDEPWESHEPEAEDERYRRCLAAAGEHLAGALARLPVEDIVAWDLTLMELQLEASRVPGISELVLEATGRAGIADRSSNCELMFNVAAEAYERKMGRDNYEEVFRVAP